MPYVDLRGIARTGNHIQVHVMKTRVGIRDPVNLKLRPETFLVSVAQLEMLKHLGEGVSAHLGSNYEGPYLMADGPSNKSQRQYMYLPTMSHKQGKNQAQQVTLHWRGVLRGEVKHRYSIYMNASILHYFLVQPNAPAPLGSKVCVPLEQWETFKRAMEVEQ